MSLFTEACKEHVRMWTNIVVIEFVGSIKKDDTADL